MAVARLQLLAVGLTRSEVEGDDRPSRFVVRALVRHKAALQMPTQTRDDVGQAISIGREPIFLERVDFVADETCDYQECFSGWRCEVSQGPVRGMLWWMTK